jgi:hypothetical protein
MRGIAFAILIIGAVGVAGFAPTDVHAGTVHNTASFRHLGSKVMLNPQPLPPKQFSASRKINFGSKVMLNPQPLPPKYRGVAQRGIIIVGGKGGNTARRR